MKKTREEILKWAKDPKRKKGDKLTIDDEKTGSSSLPQIKAELEKL